MHLFISTQEVKLGCVFNTTGHTALSETFRADRYCGFNLKGLPWGSCARTHNFPADGGT